MDNLSMKTKKIAFAVMLALPLLTSYHAFADEAPAAVAATAPSAPASPWTLTSNVGVVSDYYARGASQSWHRPAIQGGIDISHSSGFYAGAFGSSISERTYVGASTEFDLYGGYNGSIAAVEGLGWTVGAVGVYYPGGGWDKYVALTNAVGNNKGVGIESDQDFTNYEANIGVSYKWLSAKFSYTLSDWYGANKDTGWSGDSDGSTYIELNANVPLPIWGLNFVAHVGRSNIKGNLSDNINFDGANGAPNAAGTALALGETSADYTDYKIGLTKTFDIVGTAGWNAGLFYTGGTNGGDTGYWGKNGYGGSSFTTTPGGKDLTDDRFVLTIGRSF